MRGSLCVPSEDGMQHSQRPGWSCDVTCTHLKFSPRPDAILDFLGFFASLSTVEGANCLFEEPVDAKEYSALNGAPNKGDM